MAGGTPPFQPNMDEMKQAIYDLMGSVTSIANHFKINPATVYKFIERNPEIEEDIKKARELNHKYRLDKARFVSMYNLDNYLNEPYLAQKVADKIEDREHAKQSQAEVITSLFERPSWVEESKKDLENEQVEVQ